MLIMYKYKGKKMFSVCIGFLNRLNGYNHYFIIGQNNSDYLFSQYVQP